MPTFTSLTAEMVRTKTQWDPDTLFDLNHSVCVVIILINTVSWGGGKSVIKRTFTVISKFYQVTLIHFHLQRNLDQVHTASAVTHPAANSLCKLPNTAEKVNKMLAKSNNNGIKAQQHGLQQCSSSILGRLH